MAEAGSFVLAPEKREFRSAHPRVERISDETPERGGTAITIVELKG